MDWVGWIFLLIGIYWFIQYVKYNRIPILDIIVIFSVYFVYYFIGYLFDTDMLNAITPHGMHGFTISFVGVFLLIGTTILVKFVINKYIDKRNK